MSKFLELVSEKQNQLSDMPAFSTIEYFRREYDGMVKLVELINRSKKSKGVFENLLKAQELQDALVDRGMEAQAALVGADGAVELDAVAAVDLNISVLIRPWHTEADDTFWLNDAGQDVFSDIFWMGFKDWLQGCEEFFNGLEEFCFMWVASFYCFKRSLDIGFCCCHKSTSF